ncbi:MAG: hypothetical protein ABIT10_10310 [Alteraurantiacibacter sp.]
MTEWDWLRLVWLAMALSLVVATVRTHQIGGRKMLVMALAWACILMVAAGIASFIGEWVDETRVAPPPPDADPVLT